MREWGPVLETSKSNFRPTAVQTNLHKTTSKSGDLSAWLRPGREVQSPEKERRACFADCYLRHGVWQFSPPTDVGWKTGEERLRVFPRNIHGPQQFWAALESGRFGHQNTSADCAPSHEPCQAKGPSSDGLPGPQRRKAANLHLPKRKHLASTKSLKWGWFSYHVHQRHNPEQDKHNKSNSFALPVALVSLRRKNLIAPLGTIALLILPRLPRFSTVIAFLRKFHRVATMTAIAAFIQWFLEGTSYAACILQTGIS